MTRPSRPWPPKCVDKGCGVCHGCFVRALWASGHFVGRPIPRRWDTYSLAEDDLIRSLAGVATVQEIADALTDRFGHTRTVAGVRCRAKTLRLSLAPAGYSMRDMERLFGEDHKQIIGWWIGQALLVGWRRLPPQGPYERWCFPEAAVERFIREHPYAYSWRRMQPGHRLRSLAELEQRRDPYITRHQLAKRLGYASGETLTRWLRRGLIPHVRRPGAGRYDDVLIRAADVEAIRAAITAAKIGWEHRRLAGLRRRWAELRRPA